MVLMPPNRVPGDLASVIPKQLRFELERSRLRAQLEPLHSVQLLALIAPSGFGKTTLLAQYARTLGDRAVWLELHEDHADPIMLGRSLMDAVQSAQPRLVLEHWRQARADASASDLARALRRDLECAEHNLSFFLDRVHLIGAQGSSWLEGFVASLPEGHRLFVAGYHAEHLPLAKWVAQGNALFLGSADLALTLEETQVYLTARQFDGAAKGVHASLEGWWAGVALVAAGLPCQIDPKDLMTEALKRLPESVRMALPAASVLEIWSEGTAAQLCELPPDWLQQVRRVGLPLTPLGNDTYRPSQVLIEVLEFALERTPKRHTALHLQAGQRAQARGDVLRALKHYRVAGLEPQAIGLVQEVAPTLLARAEFRLLRDVLEPFALAVLGPTLTGYLAIALIETGKSAHGEALLRQLRADGRADAQALYWLSRLAYHDLQFERALLLADEGLVRSEAGLHFSKLWRIKAHALMELGQQDQALEVMQRAVQWAEDRDNFAELGHNLSSLKLMQYRLGQWANCEKSIARALDVYDALGMSARTLPLLIDLASLRHLQNRAPEALQLIEQGLTLAEQEHSRLRPYFLELRGDVYLWQRDFARACEAYQLTVSKAREVNDQALVRVIGLKLVEVLWHTGQPEAATAELAQLKQDLHANPDLHGAYAFYAGLVSFWNHQLEVASAHFWAALNTSEEPTHKPRASAYLAEIARQQGKLEFEHLKHLTSSLDTMPHDHVLLVDAATLRQLFSTCIKHGWFAGRWRRFVGIEAAFTAAVTTATTPLSRPAFDLGIVTLGKLHITVNGTPIRLPFAKAGELLVFIALHGSSSLDQIINALWDGSLEPRHHEYFRVAARRLRAALGEHPAVDFNGFPFSDKVYKLATQLQPRLDITLAQQALESGDPHQLRRALEVYNGEFLPGVNTEWVSMVRTRCLEHTVAAAATLGEQLERTEPREALSVYRRAIDLEPLSEVSHLGLIRVHLALGGVAAANQAYVAYARMLSEEFGLVPSDGLRHTLEGLGLRVV